MVGALGRKSLVPHFSGKWGFTLLAEPEDRLVCEQVIHVLEYSASS